MNFSFRFKSILTTLSIVFFSGCASDGPKPPPRLDLSPNIRVENSNVGEDYIIHLKVINKIDSQSKSAYGVENNLRELFTDLITDAFEKQDFEVIDDEDEINSKTTQLTVSIIALNNRIEEDTLTSNIISNAELSVSAKKGKTEITLNFKSTRTKEVALKPSLKEVTNITELAVAQVIKRLSIDQRIQTLATSKK